MYCGFESRLCIICETPGFCRSWFIADGSGTPPIWSNPGRPSPPRPPIPAPLASPVGFDLAAVFVWEPAYTQHCKWGNYIYIILQAQVIIWPRKSGKQVANFYFQCQHFLLLQTSITVVTIQDHIFAQNWHDTHLPSGTCTTFHVDYLKQ